MKVWCENDDRLVVCSRERMIGKHVSTVLDVNSSEMLQGVFRRVAASGRGEKVQYELEARGRLVDVRGRVVPVFGRRGVVESVRLVARDVSAESQALRRLSEREVALEQLLQFTRRMNGPLDLNALFDLLVKECMEATAADAGGMTLRRGNLFVSESFYAEGKTWKDRRIWQPEDALTQWFLLKRTPCMSNRVGMDPRLRPYRARVRLHTVLTAPIMDRSGEVIAFVGVANKKGDRRFDEEDLRRVVMLAQVAAGPIQSAISLRRMEDAQHRARSASSALLKVQDDERRRIARTLHETTSQDLLAAKMNLGMVLRRSRELGIEVHDLVRQAADLVRNTMQEIRTISYVLHPPLLDESGLECALSWFVKGFAKRSEIDVDLKLDTNVGRLGGETESTLFRVAQEGLGNIHRHAGSTRASVRLWREGPQVVLEVEDYGKGMKAPEVIQETFDWQGEVAGDLSASATLNGGRNGGALPGVGIAGMRERVQELGGSFALYSAEGRGTKIRVVMQAENVSVREADFGARRGKTDQSEKGNGGVMRKFAAAAGASRS